MTARRIGSAVTWIALALIFTGIAVFFRPAWLPGGDTSTLIVSGHSMDGTYRTGDLVIVKREPGYRVGQIVGFQVPQGEAGAGMVVIHRIVGRAPEGRFVTQGDNNPERDPWSIAAEDVTGAAFGRVPAAGMLSTYLRGPLGLAAVVGGLAAWVAMGFLSPGPTPEVNPSTPPDAPRRRRRAATSRPAS